MSAERNSSNDAAPWLPGWDPRPRRLARARIKSRADIEWIERHRPEDLMPSNSIHGCLAAAMANHPDKPAMIALESADLAIAPRIVSYRELVSGIMSCANMFMDMADGETPSVANVLPMIPEGLICSYAAATCGIATPINPFLELHHIAGILRASQTNILVTTDDQIWKKLAPIRDSVPSLRHVLLVGAGNKAHDFAERASRYRGDRLDFQATDPRASSVHLPTGGTTAAPKLAKLSQQGLLTVAWVVGSLMGPQEDGVVGHAMPNFHVGGLCSLGLRALLHGQTLLTLTREGFRNAEVIRNFWNIARRYRMTSVLSTPTTAAALLADRDAIADGHIVGDFHCGGSSVPVALMQGFHERFGVWLRENWGMTELHGTMTGHPNDGQQPVIGSVGCTLPFFRTKAIVVSDDNVFERECAPGERGALALGGPTVTQGYVDSTLDDAYIIKGMPDGERWGNTGDVGAIDENGYVWLYGRSKDVIIRGGHNIDPKPVEEVLVQFPGVQLAAMVGKPDASKGELPVAYLQIRPGIDVDLEALKRFCASEVHERAALPVDIIVLDAMPLTAVGKIAKPVLKIDILQRTVEEIAGEVLGGGQWTISIDTSGRPTANVGIDPDSGVTQAQADALARRLAGFEFRSNVSFAPVSGAATAG